MVVEAELEAFEPRQVAKDIPEEPAVEFVVARTAGLESEGTDKPVEIPSPDKGRTGVAAVAEVATVDALLKDTPIFQEALERVADSPSVALAAGNPGKHCCFLKQFRKLVF